MMNALKKIFRLGAACLGVSAAMAARPAPVVRLLLPGFEAQALPIEISNVNNLRFAPDGRLTALGYDGRIHLLRDANGDGLEDEDTLFWDRPTLTVPVGMVWAPEGLYVSSHGKVSLLRDTDGDGKADVEEIIASGWPPTDVASGGVDATAVTRDAAGNLYFGLLVANYANAYRLTNGVPHYDLHSPRGTIQKWVKATGKLETICTGIRVPYSLVFNRAGDLFVTDQEGATWMPNGNPLDELDWILPGRNYGFPPRHPKYLPNLISEPPVVAFGPQHQSSCGFVFDEPTATQPLFGPARWEGDALVAGESRGKIWRVRLVKIPSGYVGKEMILARLSMLTLDVAISPRGALYVTCHSGLPDWGAGPRGPGKILKIVYRRPDAPQPIAIWPSGLMEVRVAFDRPLDPSCLRTIPGSRIEFGEYVRAADRWEVLKPPYEAVRQQEETPRGHLPIAAAQLEDGGRTLVLRTAPHPNAVKYALALAGIKAAGAAGAGWPLDLDYDFQGAEIQVDARGRFWRAWWPHPVWKVAEKFLQGSALWERCNDDDAARRVVLQSDLLFPAGEVWVRAWADAPFQMRFGSSAGGAALTHGRFEAMLTARSSGRRIGWSAHFESSDKRLPRLLDFAYHTADDPTWRPVPLDACYLPWAPPHIETLPASEAKSAPKLAGDFARGRRLFFGQQLRCATCHRIRGEGGAIGPDLSNLASRDPESVLRDIRQPSASINPDYVAFNLELADGGVLTGFVRGQTPEAVSVMTADGATHLIARRGIRSIQASAVSLMPEGLLAGMAPSSVADLLAFLCGQPPPAAAAPPARERQ